MDDDRAALLAAMYDDDTEETSDQNTEQKTEADLLSAKRSRRIVMGAVAFDVPTVEYVALLEARVAQQERVIINHARNLKRLEILLSALRNVVRRNVNTLGDVSRDLDNKLDRRELS